MTALRCCRRQLCQKRAACRAHRGLHRRRAVQQGLAAARLRERARLQASSSLTHLMREGLAAPVRAFLVRMEAAIEADCDGLTDGGRDRMFTSACSSLARATRLLADCASATEADQLVRALVSPAQRGC